MLCVRGVVVLVEVNPDPALRLTVHVPRARAVDPTGGNPEISVLWHVESHRPVLQQHALHVVPVDGVRKVVPLELGQGQVDQPLPEVCVQLEVLNGQLGVTPRETRRTGHVSLDVLMFSHTLMIPRKNPGAEASGFTVRCDRS